MQFSFIGFGEAARAFADSLRMRPDAPGLAAYDIRMDAEMAEAMARLGVRRAATPAEALAGAAWIFSAVTADQSLAAIEAVAPHLLAGQIVFDINSVSPGRKRETAALVEAAGGAYLDVAVMAPVHPKGHATPVLLAGVAAERLAPSLAALGFSLDVVGPEPGAATAIKMVRSLFVKGLEAITVEALIAASASGCFDRVYESLSESFPGLGWPDCATYTFERALRHGARRAAEMRESAATLEAVGLVGGLAAQVAEVQARMGALPISRLPGTTLADGVAEVTRLRLGGSEAPGSAPKGARSAAPSSR
jgi:3-hydroxyisobutyrate dehydrogenase-like beta-hydroxyacid dehydrogenase